MAILNNSNAISTTGGYDINNSLRFRSSASAYLSRTPASSGNRRTWTWSAWVKRGALGSFQVLFGAGLNNGANADELVSIYFTNNDQLGHYVNETSVADRNNISTAVFRDPSAWYHIVAIYDSTQATASNRQRLFVNGVEITAWSATSYVSQNYQPSVNSNSYPHAIGKYGFNATRFFDGYMTEVNFIDGQALTPTSFGETDTTTGVWKPKAYTGTYGTNGFYLKFSDIATTSGSNAGLGKDFSGNTNYWTTNNISVTAGTTYDAMIDSPTLTSATVANYATLNPNLRQTGTGQAPTSANLKLTANTTGYSQVCCATIASTSGKFYWEVTVNGGYGGFGIADSNNSAFTSVVCTTSSVTANPGQYTWGWNLEISNGNKQNNNVSTSYGSAASSGDVYMCAVDIDNGKVWWGKNGTWFASGNPASGTNAAFTNVSGNIIPYFSPTDAGGWTQDVNFGQRPFSYTPPTGFVRLNTYNLPDSTVKKGNTVMDATTYTGDGASTKTISGLNFQPDFIWIKRRDGASDHNLQDAVRGFSSSTKLASSSNYAENIIDGLYTDPKWGYVSAVSSTGFTVTKSTNGDHVNVNASPYVAWAWDANGSGATNTAGSTTSTVSVNTTAGFSIVTYTGTAANATIGHGLGVAPKFIIIKNRSTGVDWRGYHTSLGATAAFGLNLTATPDTNSAYFNNTNPTSSVFSVGSSLANNGSGNSIVAYCWAEIAGFSKAFSYTGNGSSDGPMVYLGFRPKWILIKNASNGVQGWTIQDTSRSTYNVVDNYLLAQASSAEQSIYAQMDYLSNGFKVRTSDALVNGSGNTIIGMAFAENPFKNSNAR